MYCESTELSMMRPSEAVEATFSVGKECDQTDTVPTMCEL